MHEDNIFDKKIAQLPESDLQALLERYSRIDLAPKNLKFIDRMVADSRQVALNHTAGLSLPQQTQMVLFSMLSLLDTGDTYRQQTCSYFGVCGGGAGSNKYWENGTFRSTQTQACYYSIQVLTDVIVDDLEKSLGLTTS